MAEFTPIETQEEFDRRISDRLERERNTVRKEYADYDSLKTSLEAKRKEAEEMAGRITGFENEISELKTKLSKSETDSAKTRIAYEMGLPKEMVSRLSGTNEEEIRKDAEAIAKLFKSQQKQPLYNPEGAAADKKTEAFKEMLSNLKI